MFNDKQLNCKDCGATFTFTAEEQEFYAQKGFENEPGRCSECRSARKAQNRNSGRRNGYDRSGPREMHPATCAACGKETTVPFKPSGDKPVYCKDCFQPRSRSNQY